MTDDISSRVKIGDITVLSNNWYILRKVHFSWLRSDGKWHEGSRECYDRGDGVAVLLYNRRQRSIVLTRQLRIPPYTKGYRELMIEVPAGLLEGAEPEERARKEVEEETGFRVGTFVKLFEAYMSPGAVTEKLHYYMAEYEAQDRAGDGGGLIDEGEDIEVLEIGFDEALAMMKDGCICDAKTILLLQHAQLHVFTE